MPIEVIYVFLLSGISSAISIPTIYYFVFDETITVGFVVKSFFIGLIPFVGVVSFVVFLAVILSELLDLFVARVKSIPGSNKVFDFFQKLADFKLTK